MAIHFPIEGKTVFITGADGGIGLCLLEECLRRGARLVYASGRNTDRLKEIENIFGHRVTAITLDVTDYATAQRYALACADTDILINNAGVEAAVSFLNLQGVGKAAFEMNVNYFGMHNVTHAFKDTLLARPCAAIVNILSIASFTIIPKLATYCASKAAGHVLTQACRAELAETGVSVIGVYPGYVDTAMVQNLDVVKVTPESIAVEICAGVEQGATSIFPDPMSKALSQSGHCKTPFIDESLQ